MKTLYKSELHSLIGNLYLFFNKKELLNISINTYNNKWINHFFPDTIIKKSYDNIFLTQLKEYFYGLRKEFDLPIMLLGSKFQKDVWKSVSKIPFGDTISYKEVAQNINRKSAQRAVGNALSKNPLLIIIPCHRVIKSNGNLGGFSAGVDVKKKLLSFEKEIFNG